MLEGSQGPRKWTASYRFLTVNDVYAYKPDRYGIGGFLQLATLVKKYRTERNCALVVAGDFLGGSSLAVEFQGKNVIEVLNALEVDHVVLGNHEFDYGADVLQQRMKESNFRWFGSNVRQSENGELFPNVTDTLLVPVVCEPVIKNGERMEPLVAHIGVFGVCTEMTRKLSYPGDTVYFEPIIDRAKVCVSALNHQADVIVALTHVSLLEDKTLTKHVPEIDVILGGHDHLPYGEFHENTFIFKCGESAHWLGCLDLDIEITVDPAGVKECKAFPSWRMIMNRGQELDPQLEAIYNKYVDMQMQAEEGMDEVLAKVTGADLPTFTDTVRRKEAAFGSLIADALLHEYHDDGPDFAIINGGFIRGNTSYPIGALLTVFHIRNELPFPRPAVCVRMLGRDVVSALEVMVGGYPRPQGCFPHVSGNARVVFDDEKPAGRRIVSVTVRGQALEPDREYTVVISEFMAMGGDDNESFARNTLVANHGRPINQSVIEFLRRKGTVNAVLEGRVRLANQ